MTNLFLWNIHSTLTSKRRKELEISVEKGKKGRRHFSKGRKLWKGGTRSFDGGKEGRKNGRRHFSKGQTEERKELEVQWRKVRKGGRRHFREGKD